MKVTYLMVFLYISFCIRIATKPCKYFQLNSPYFDRKEGIFSKIAIDKLIPERWRLIQDYDDGVRTPGRYPVFVKPEWGQNANGIYRADNPGELRRIREKTRGAKVKYLIQQGAMEKNEYEIFSLQHHRDPERYAILTVTQACNDRETSPVNSIYNDDTRYVEITDHFSTAELERIWSLVRRIEKFRISRVCVRADSTADLLQGKFHIIEINLFLPFPINMLDSRYSPKDIFKTVMAYMMCLALATKYRDKSLECKPVFTKIMLYNRESRFLNFWRARI